MDAVFYTEPEPGVKASWSKSDIKEELANICGFEVRERASNKGEMRSGQAEAILSALGRAPSSSLAVNLETLGDICGFEATGSVTHYHCLTKDQLWRILETVKEHRGEWS